MRRSSPDIIHPLGAIRPRRKGAHAACPVF